MTEAKPIKHRSLRDAVTRSAAARLLLVGGAPYAWLSRRLAHALCDVASGVMSHVAVRPALHLDEGGPHAALGIRMHLGGRRWQVLAAARATPFAGVMSKRLTNA